jgi:hypothetical protein
MECFESVHLKKINLLTFSRRNILYSPYFLGSPESAKDAASPGAVPPGLHVPDAEIHPGNAQKHYESDP